MLLALLVAAALALTTPAAAAALHRKYSTGNKRATDGRVNVHIISHTHDDVGWLKTVDQYFYGANNTIQHANVNSIISAHVLALLEDPNRKFSYCEQAFFSRWWEEQDAAKQADVRSLIDRGQLEFINGGWSMHDEACPTFVDMIDNTHLGGRLIYETFGVVPRTTWQIDPFGHSAFTGSSLASPLSGVNGVYVARMDYQDISSRKPNKATEMFWAPSPSAPNQGGVLGFLPYWYYAPNGFDFGGDDNTQPIQDDPTLEDYNVPDVVARFNALIDDQVSFTAGVDTMIMMGTDFSGENAQTWYRNIDKLIHHVSTPTEVPGSGKYNVLYSTPSAYTAAKVASTPLPLRSEDVMPYADGPHAFWSGYFSSRPALKGYVRDSSAVFQAAKQLQALAAPPADMTPANPLYLLERAMGVTQHHDAVSGTSKQHVANDYALRLAKGRAAAAPAQAAALAALSRYAAAPFAACDLANVTICPALEDGKGLAVLVYNQQSSALAGQTLRLPLGVAPGGYSATDAASGAALPAQAVALTPDDLTIRQGYYNYTSPVPVQWLEVALPPLPAMGFAVVLVQPAAAGAAAAAAAAGASAATAPAPQPLLRDTTISNGLTTLTFSAATGLLTTFNAQPFSQTFLWWNSSTGNAADDQTSDFGQSSGAYIFRPNGTTPFAVAGAGGVAATQTAFGPVLWEVTQVFAPWAVGKVRLHANSSAVEFEWSIGPIPFADGNGKEVVSRFDAGRGFASGGAWVSDANGRDAIARQRDARRSWNYTVIEPVSGNYVPANLFQTISNGATQYSVVTDRTQAGSSMVDGALDFMVHRRLLADDNRGVGEALNETGLSGLGLVVRGRHWVTQDAVGGAGRALRALAAASLFKPLWAAAPFTGGAGAWAAAGALGAYSGLRAPLPPNLHLVTVHAQSPRALLLRVAHMFAVGEDSALSAPASLDLRTLFAGFNITSAEETILPGTEPLSAAPSTTYSVIGGGSVTLPVVPPAPAGPGLTVTLSAMQIRTFRCQRDG